MPQVKLIKKKPKQLPNYFLRKKLSTKIYNFENVQNVHNGTENESDVTKNWYLPLLVRRQSLRGRIYLKFLEVAGQG